MNGGALATMDDGSCLITRNRLDRLNASPATRLNRFNATLGNAAAHGRVRAVYITGAGRGFYAGRDLNDRAVAPGDTALDLGESLENCYNPAIRLISSMPKSVVVAVNGVAAGAGANLTPAGDIVFTAESAEFIHSCTRIGLKPDFGGRCFWPSKVGTAAAPGLSLLGEAPSAAEAGSGLIWKVVADDELQAEAGAVARRLALDPTAGYAKTKQASNASGHNTLDSQLDLERDLQRAAGRSNDYREGVVASLEKRASRFEGR